MKSFAKALGLTVIGLLAFQLPGQAQTETRISYSEVRPNGSSFAAAFETTVPDFVDIAIANPTLTVNVTNPGTDQSQLTSLVADGVSYTSPVGGEPTIEAAIARSIDAAPPTAAEDIIGVVRAFVGPEGNGSANASAVLD